MVLIKNNGDTEIRLAWESWTFIISPGNWIKVSAPVAQAILRRFPNAAQLEEQPPVEAPQDGIVVTDDSDEDLGSIVDPEPSSDGQEPVSTGSSPVAPAPKKVSPAQIRNEARKQRKR